MVSERYAKSKNGRIISLNEANPPQELKEGQFDLTKMEFKLLYAISDLEEIEKLVKSIREKMKASEG